MLQWQTSDGDISWANSFTHVFTACLDSFIISLCSNSQKTLPKRDKLEEKCLYSEKIAYLLVYSFFTSSLKGDRFRKLGLG